MRINELPNEERPRERLLRFGAAALSNSELLAIVLRNGYNGKSAFSLAQELLSVSESGLAYIAGATPEELAGIKGIGLAKACELSACMEIGKRMASRPRTKRMSVTNSYELSRLFMEDMRYLKQEIMKLLLLNVKGEILGIESVSVGSLTSAVVHPREIFRPAIAKNAAGIVMVHNHPSGDPTPSDDDLELTRRISEAGELLGVIVLDHLIIGDGVYISFRDRELF